MVGALHRDLQTPMPQPNFDEIQRLDRRTGFLGVTRPSIGRDAIAEVADSLRSGWVIAGPKVRTLEQMLEDRLSVPHVRALAGCSAGLFLGLKLSGVGPGDEVLLPTLTFAGCANVIEQLGARPRLVDSEPGTGLIDLDAAERQVGPRTKAILPVHLGGRPLDMERLAAVRDRHGIAVVEDAAHAIGAAWGGRPIGSHGNLVSFSFHATKNMTTVEGGALALQRAEDAERVGRLASQGLSRSSWERHGSAGPADYDVTEPGYKLSMSDVDAAVGIHQLPELDRWIDVREALARRYDELLAGLPLELEPPPEPGSRHARHVYAVRVRDDAAVTRDELIERLRAARIGTSIHFKAVHLLTYYRDRYGLEERAFPVATAWSRRTVSLPLHPTMSRRDQDDVVAALGAALA